MWMMIAGLDDQIALDPGTRCWTGPYARRGFSLPFARCIGIQVPHHEHQDIILTS
jgi:hypothetical protein